MEDDTVRYVMLAVASDQEAQRLIDDLTEHPDEPLRTPRWSNAVHAVLTPTQPTDPPPRRHLHLVDLDAVPARLKSRLRPMRGLKRLRSVWVISAGHAFVQNLRRSRYEVDIDVDSHHRPADAFTDLPLAI